MNKALVTSVLVAGIGIAGTSILVSQADAEDAAPQVEESASPETITVESAKVGGAIILGGTVIPQKIVNLSAQMPGDVKFVAGSEGDSFKKGERLIALDTAALMAKRRQAEIQLASANAAYQNAMVQYNRELYSPNSQSNAMLGGAPSMFSMFSDPMRSMTGQGSPGYERHSSLYGQNTQVLTARNQIEQAKAAIRELDESLENAVSYAPFDGVILKKMVELGDIVQPGMPLVSFADTSQLQIRVEVPTNLLKILEEGATVQAKLDGEDKYIDVTVDRIFPMADMGGHTTTVKFGLAASTEAHSGLYAEVMIPDPSKTASAHPVVPESAILWRGSLPAVFQVAGDGKLKLRLIRIGDRTSDGKVSVISGINVGDTILAKPSPSARGGS